MSPTIYDIARVAGVSKSTVSRVLNKQTNISPEAREKVLRAIDELQYQPNKLARALTSSGFDAIMVISTRSTKTTAGNPFFGSAARYYRESRGRRFRRDPANVTQYRR